MPPAPHDVRPLSDFVHLAELGPEAFLSAVPEPVLVITASAGQLGQVDARTVTNAGDALRDEPLLEWAVPLRKRSRSFGDGIWIGRAPSCDVVLPFESISKVHAVVQLDIAGALAVADAGSKNGTLLGNLRLQRGRLYPLGEAASLRLGDVSVQYLSPIALQRKLARRR